LSYDCNIDIGLSLVDICHVVRTVPLYKYWSPFLFPLTVGRRDTSQNNDRRLFFYVVEACVSLPLTRLYGRMDTHISKGNKNEQNNLQ